MYNLINVLNLPYILIMLIVNIDLNRANYMVLVFGNPKIGITKNN